MKIRIPTSTLQIGMYVDSMEGSWWLNPFWKSSFRIASQKDLDRLQASCVEWVIIDDVRGTAPEKAVPPAPVARPPLLAVSTAARLPERRALRRPIESASTDFATERAIATVDQSKRAVRRMFTDVRLGRAIEPEAMGAVVDRICDAVGDDPTAMLKVTRLKKKNEYTYLHSVAVSALMIALGRHLQLDDAEVRELGLAGILHDIGKMAVPEALLEKPGRLSDDEFRIVRTHPEEGYALLLEDKRSSIVKDVILHHHEKLDGSGYPHRLSGDAVSLHARIAAVCDVYDAVTSKRSYKRQWSPNEALTQMREWSGHFDPVILDAFMRCIGIYPVGLLVRLRSNRLAIVQTENAANPTQPMVRAFYLCREACFVDPVDLRLSTTLQGDKVVAIEDPERWFAGEWDDVRTAVLTGTRPGRRAPEPLRAAAR